jgi:uncharacterized membrane protein HdeD (DUF308 family)
MNAKNSFRLLQFVLGLVLFLESAALVIQQFYAGPHSHAFYVLLVLGGVEAIAAAIFLFADSIGGPILLATFAAAFVCHLLHGQFGPLGGLLVYAAGVFAIMQERKARDHYAK